MNGNQQKNKNLNFPKSLEMELVGLKLKKEKEEMQRKGEKFLTEEEAIEKYRFLKHSSFKQNKT